MLVASCSQKQARKAREAHKEDQRSSSGVALEWILFWILTWKKWKKSKETSI